MNKLALEQPFRRVNDTTALLVVSVIAWLWAVPVIDSLESYTYGSATNTLMISFILFVIGVVAAVGFPQFSTLKRSRCALIAGCVLLSIGVVFFVPICFVLTWRGVSHFVILRILGFMLLGYGLQSMCSEKKWSFKKGIIVLVVLYIIYNLLIWGKNNLMPDYIFLYKLANILYGLIQIAIVVAAWKTLSADSVADFLSKAPKISLLAAGLFWGMILVLPPDRYSPRWLSILMFILGPVLAYIYSIIARLAYKSIKYVIRGFISERFWWKEVCLWWKHDSAKRLEE